MKIIRFSFEQPNTLNFTRSLVQKLIGQPITLNEGGNQFEAHIDSLRLVDGVLKFTVSAEVSDELATLLTEDLKVSVRTIR